jgi:hypothetical protein
MTAMHFLSTIPMLSQTQFTTKMELLSNQTNGILSAGIDLHSQGKNLEKAGYNL